MVNRGGRKRNLGRYPFSNVISVMFTTRGSLTTSNYSVELLQQSDEKHSFQGRHKKNASCTQLWILCKVGVQWVRIVDFPPLGGRDVSIRPNAPISRIICQRCWCFGGQRLFSRGRAWNNVLGSFDGVSGKQCCIPFILEQERWT